VAILFLYPPSRRPYELYYLCNLSEDVVIVIDTETFAQFSDDLGEFREFNFRFIFVPLEPLRLGKILKFEETAALINYSNKQISKILDDDKNIGTIVTVELFSSLSAQASRLSSKYSLRHIVVIWENLTKTPLYYIPPYSTNTKIVKSTASKFITVSNKSRQSIIPLHIDIDKIKTVHPGIFVHKFKVSSDSNDKILFVGVLDRHKGVSILLQAFKKLSNYLPEVKLVLVGKGTLEPEVIKLKNSGLRIDYMGFVSNRRLIDIYSDCSIFCSPILVFKMAGLIPIWQEQFGFALVEAMSSGLPIVTSNVGAIPEIVGAENLVVTPTSENVFAALYKVLNSNDLRKRLRESNRKRSISMFNAPTQSLLFEKAINT
jgi:glycosyltransferase involved in cell wall biosynthesis